jgi:hypothetical protein
MKKALILLCGLYSISFTANAYTAVISCGYSAFGVGKIFCEIDADEGVQLEGVGDTYGIGQIFFNSGRLYSDIPILSLDGKTTRFSFVGPSLEFWDVPSRAVMNSLTNSFGGTISFTKKEIVTEANVRTLTIPSSQLKDFKITKGGKEFNLSTNYTKIDNTQRDTSVFSNIVDLQELGIKNQKVEIPVSFSRGNSTNCYSIFLNKIKEGIIYENICLKKDGDTSFTINPEIKLFPN